MTETRTRKPRVDGVRTRAALVRAAQDIFSAVGIDAPLDAIARRAQVANATLYRHFPKRIELVTEVLMLALHRGEAALARANECATSWEGLKVYLEWIFAEQVQNRAYMSGLKAIPSETNSEVDTRRDRTVAGVKALIDGAKSEGTFRTDRWMEDVFLFMALNEQMAETGVRDIQVASQRFLELCLASLSTEPWSRHESAETAAVLALRNTLGHDIAGLPLNSGPVVGQG